MKRFIQKALQSLVIVPALALSLGAVAPAVPAFASGAGGAATTDCSGEGEISITSGVTCAQGDQKGNLFGQNGIFQQVTNILLFIVGTVSVIMLIIGGIRYVVSGGDQSQVTSAKNTILYAIVGIVISFLAFAAVQFVINGLGNAQ